MNSVVIVATVDNVGYGRTTERLEGPLVVGTWQHGGEWLYL